MLVLEILVSWLLIVLLTVLVVSYLARRWGRDPFGWMLLSAAMGPIAVIALLGTRQSDIERGRRKPGGSPARAAGRMLVLVACDGSAPGLEAARHAATLEGDVEVMLVTVLPHESRPQSDMRSQADYDARVSAALEESREILRAAGVQTQDAVAFGAPGEEIVRRAADGGADLIIIGRRGAGLSRALLGSTSDYVVKHAPCTVTVVG